MVLQYVYSCLTSPFCSGRSPGCLVDTELWGSPTGASRWSLGVVFFFFLVWVCFGFWLMCFCFFQFLVGLFFLRCGFGLDGVFGRITIDPFCRKAWYGLVHLEQMYSR